jgi:hypothetical protein
MHAAIFKTLPIFSIVTALTLALAFAPVSFAKAWACPPVC